MYCPWTGLGLYDGFRGNKWLKNRIKIFKQFVIPSLLAQTNKDFILLCSWRRKEKSNPIVKEFIKYLNSIKDFKTIHTFAGILFYDDKYEDSVARERLVSSVHSSMGEIINAVGECDYILMTIQPSDDLYCTSAVADIQRIFKVTDFEAIGFSKGYICNYLTKEVAEYNPETNPPFYTIKFPRETFIEPRKHCEYTALKKDVGKYKVGTPCPSHEYIGDCLKYGVINERGFLVGTHSVNISTTFTNPYKGNPVPDKILEEFGIMNSPPLHIKIGLRKRILLKLPFWLQKKIRYILGEKLKI